MIVELTLLVVMWSFVGVFAYMLVREMWRHRH